MPSLVERPSAARSVDGARRPAEPEEVLGDGWSTVERVVAFVVTVLVAMRIVILPQVLLTVGDLLVVAALPLWLPVTRRFVGARSVLVLSALAIVAGALLTVASAADHEAHRGYVFIAITLMIRMSCGFGFLLWARHKLGDATLAAGYGFGLLIGVSHTSTLYSTNPWKFGYSVPVTVFVLALSLYTRNRLIPLLTVLILAVASALTDARSNFALLLLTASLLAWQMRPLHDNWRGSALRALLGLGMLGAVIYNVGQSLIINGYLGAMTQLRSLQQVTETGSLILGGRPELAATVALMRERFWGFGSGTVPNLHDIAVARAGMAAINYDPDNGYIDNWMFGNGFSLHSVAGDLWAQSGLVGLALSVVVLAVTLRGLSRRLASSTASALLLYVSSKTIWNILFGPWYSSIPLLVLTLALTMLPGSPEETIDSDVAAVRHP